MNQTILSALLALWVTAAFATPNVKPIPLQGEVKAYEYRLDNGLTIFLMPNRKAPLTSVYHWVKAGSLHEKKGVTGIAHLFEHMMFRPINRDDRPFWDYLKDIEGDANANTRFTSTVYTTTVPHKKLQQLLKLESARFKGLKVTDALLDIERKAVWSEYSVKFDSNPIIDLWYAIYKYAFPNHPYGWTIIGEREDLDKIKATDCNEFFSKYYRPNNTGLFIAGDFDQAQVLSWIQADYSNWERGQNSSLPAPYNQSTKYVFASGKLPASSKNILAGFRIPEYNSSNYNLLNFIGFLTTGSDYNLAIRRLRHSKQIASSVTGFNFDYDSGMLKFMIVLLPQSKISEAVDQLLQLPNDLQNMDDAEYRAYLKDFQISQRENLLRNESLNSTAALSWGKWGGMQILSDMLNKPFQIEKHEVLAFMKKHMTKNNLVVVVNKGTKDE